MFYGELKKCDIANGYGVRVSLFVSGCRNHCKGCFNQCTWDFAYGKLFTGDTEDEIMKALAPSHIAGLSVLGGEPFEEENQAVLAGFLQRVKQVFPTKNVWCYTGYDYYKDILPDNGRKHCQATKLMLENIDVIVDGRFVEEEKDITLAFRGSRNQRIIQIRQ